tara:strand:- start:550 stop:855 length:306 start_codon:yes stop_codon:yes gene_type:complete
MSDWIKKKEPKKNWITKKEPKKDWITKKSRADIQDEARTKYRKGGHVNTRRENRLEELGRVDAEHAYTKKGKRNLRAEKKRIVREVSSRGAAKRGHGKEIK